jgi:tetratricopeptide (TPR) repeat protein
MTDVKRANEIAQEAMDLWSSGKLLEAADRFREAIQLSPRTHYRTSHYHGSLGCILSELNQDDEALKAFSEALSIELEVYKQDSASPAVAMARYFLGEHFLKIHREADAVSCVTESLPNASGQEALLRTVEADGLWRLGRQADAQRSAKLAIDAARTEEQREGIRERLLNILSADLT